MNSFLALSLGLCLSLGLTWLFARKCARWLDDSWWSREFGIQVWVTVIWSVLGVILPMRNGGFHECLTRHKIYKIPRK